MKPSFALRVTKGLSWYGTIAFAALCAATHSALCSWDAALCGYAKAAGVRGRSGSGASG